MTAQLPEGLRIAQAEHAAALAKHAPAPTTTPHPETPVPSTATYHRQEVGQWIVVDAASDSLLRTTVRATSHGQFRDGTQVTLSLLRKMDYFPSQDVATPPAQPAYTKRVGEYDPTSRQYPAYVAIDGESEQLVGCAWSAGAADRLCDDYLFHHYADHHTPEVAATIAVRMSEIGNAPEPYCFFHPDTSDHDTEHCPKLDEPALGAPSYSVFN